MLGLLPILRENQCLIIHFVLVGRICGRAGVAWSLRLRVLEGLPAIKEGEAAVNGLGVTIIPIAILVLEVGSETTKTLTMRTAQHKSCEEFVPDGRDCECALRVGWLGRVRDEPIGSKVLDFGGEESRHNAHHTNASIGL